MNRTALFALFVAVALGYLTFSDPAVTTGARIGAHHVPVLECQEDEAIGYNPRRPAPRELECVHYEILENTNP